MREKWIKAFGASGYEVSDLGRVKSLNYRGEKRIGFLKPVLQKGGYNHVKLAGKNQKLSRLILKSFLGINSRKKQANHINGVKNDDRLSNLEWCTASENILHAYANGLKARGNAHHKSKLNPTEVFKIRTDPRPEREIAKAFRISQVTVNRIKRKMIWKHI